MRERIIAYGPGSTVTEPDPDDDAFARWRPVLDRLSPDDRANLELAIALQPSRRAKDRIVAEAAARLEADYVDADWRDEPEDAHPSSEFYEPGPHDA